MRDWVSLMALRDLFRKHPTPGTQPLSAGGSTRLRSPWAKLTPKELVYADVFGDSDLPRTYTRADALRVPAIAAARNRVHEHLAGRPLASYPELATTRADRQPAWATQAGTSLAISPYQRMVASLDDHIFDGITAWAVTREGDEIAEALHIPFDRWELDENGVFYFDGEETPSEQVLIIPAAHGGLLREARDTIEGGLALERAWRARARNPVPSVILKEREDNGMTLEEAKEYVDAVAAARRNPDGAVMFIPYKIEAEFEEHTGESFLEAARNAIRLDVAAYFNLTAQSVEASKAQSTLTYETAEQADRQTTDRMSFWSEPIEARLSLDDVVPAGERVRFDFTTPNHPATGTPAKD